MVDFKIEDNCYLNNKFVGTTVCKKITVNILNPNNEINLENKEISVQTGMIINDIEETVPFGNFIIEKPDTEEAKEKTKFTGYDYMVKFNTLYKNRVIFPIPAKELFEDVCDQVGLEAGNTDFINSNYMILGNPFTNNEDCRTVLSNIAQLAGGFARIGRDNKPYIVSLKNLSKLLKVKDVNAMSVEELNITIVKMLSGDRSNADEEIDGNNYLDDFSKNNEWGELNSLILGISDIEGENTTRQDEDSIQKNGLTELVIEDNYFLTDQTEREKVITTLWSELKGIKYLPFKTTYYGYPYLDAGDVIYVQDTKDNGYISYIFNHTFTFNGGYSGTLETTAMTKTQTAYKNIINGKTRFRQVERKIDKINGVIEDIIEEQTETSTKLTQVEQDIDGITQTVSSVETKVEQVEDKAENAQASANNAQTTANTANQNAQNAQETADNATTQISTTNQKVSQIEQTIEGITQSVSEVEEQIETVDNKADAAQNTANNINTNLTTNYYNKTETNSQINQKANEITSSVSQTYSTKTETENAKQEAITAAAASTDEKLEDYSTTLEMNSIIEQTASSINLEVSKKVGEDEIISKINQSAEEIQISSDKIDISGKSVSFKTNISTQHSFTQEDATKLYSYVRESGTLTDSEYELYDLDKDGIVSFNDYIELLGAIEENEGTLNKEGTLQIDPLSADRSIILRDANEEVSTSIGLTGIQTKSLGANQITVENLESDNIETYNLKVNNLEIVSDGNFNIFDTGISFGIIGDPYKEFTVNLEDCLFFYFAGNSQFMLDFSGTGYGDSSDDNAYLKINGTTVLEGNKDGITIPNLYGTNIYNEKGKIPEIEHGTVRITPSAPNTPTGKAVMFESSFSGNPTIVTSPICEVPGTVVLGVSGASRSSSGFTAYVTRTSTTSTTIGWMAMR